MIRKIKEKYKFGKEKIVHVGYAKRTLENWATFSFPRRLSISVTSFFKIQLKNKNEPLTLHRSQKKQIEKFIVIYIVLPSVDFN